MTIAYVGRVQFNRLVEVLSFDRSFPDVPNGFALGSEFAIGLVKRGHAVHVVYDCLVDKVEKFKSKCGRFTLWLVPCRKRSRWTFLTLFTKEVRGIRNAIGEIRPDVVFSQWTYHNAYAGLTSGYPTLVVAHDSPWRVFKMFRNIQTFIKAVYATLFVVPKIKHITAVSPYIVREFKKFRCLKTVDIPVIPNGIEIGDERGGMRQTFASPIPHPSSPNPCRPTIVCISQAGRLKNSATLFKAWEILKPKHPDWRLLVYGQGVATRAELDRVLREEADLLVSPSLEESFGMVFVEAMRFGVPCIGGEKSGAVSWVIGDGGVVCDVTKPEKLAECIERVMGDIELRKKLSECGKRRVREMFDIEKVVDLYESELRTVCDFAAKNA